MYDGDLLVGDGTSKASIGPLTPASQSIISLFPEHPVTPLVKQFMEYIESVRYYPIEEIEEEPEMDFVSQDDYLDWVNTPSAPINNNRQIIFKLIDLFLNRLKTSGNWKICWEFTALVSCIKFLSIHSICPVNPFTAIIQPIPGNTTTCNLSPTEFLQGVTIKLQVCHSVQKEWSG